MATMRQHDYANKKVILDSNVWIGQLIATDTLHDRATKLADTLGDSTVVVPEYVLLEVITILKVHKRYTEAKAFGERVLGNSVTYLPALGLARVIATTCFKKEYRNLSFVDTALLVLSKEYEIITFDTALQKAIDAQ